MKRRTFSLLAAGLLIGAGLAIAMYFNPLRTQYAGRMKTEPDNRIEVTDSKGRKVPVPGNVQKIACLYAMTGYATVMLDRGPDIVAVVDGLKRDTLLTEICPAIKKAAVPLRGGAVNIEELLQTDPDVIFISGDMAANETEIAKLNQSRIPYLVIDYHNMKEQEEAVRIIGQAIGTAAKAAKFNDYYEQCERLVGSRTLNIAADQRIRVYHSVNEPTRTDGGENLTSDWLRMAGAVDVSREANLNTNVDNKYFVSPEQILAWEPDVIIANEEGVADVFSTGRQWATLKAVKNKQVYQMPAGISRWGHPGGLETPLALLWTAKLLYPAVFSDIDIVAETKSFYADFFNYQLTDDTITRMLSGRQMILPKKKAD